MSAIPPLDWAATGAVGIEAPSPLSLLLLVLGELRFESTQPALIPAGEYLRAQNKLLRILNLLLDSLQLLVLGRSKSSIPSRKGSCSSS